MLMLGLSLHLIHTVSYSLGVHNLCFSCMCFSLSSCFKFIFSQSDLDWNKNCKEKADEGQKRNNVINQFCIILYCILFSKDWLSNSQGV
ncbi:hypothetical protein LINPERHAP1_LOCUS13149 [Linum perenne]